MRLKVSANNYINNASIPVHCNGFSFGNFRYDNERSNIWGRRGSSAINKPNLSTMQYSGELQLAIIV